MTMLSHSKGEIKVVDGTKVVNHLALRWGGYPGLSGWPNIITRVFTSGRGRQNVNVHSSTLQVEEGGRM